MTDTYSTPDLTAFNAAALGAGFPARELADDPQHYPDQPMVRTAVLPRTHLELRQVLEHQQATEEVRRRCTQHLDTADAAILAGNMELARSELLEVWALVNLTP